MHAAPALYRPADVRTLEQAIIEQESISAQMLMLRAAAAVFAVLQREWPQARRLCVACGPGNNGGDGYVLARLARAAGLEAQVVVPDGRLPQREPAARAYQQWRETGGEELAFRAGDALPQADVIVDALFGIGLSRAAQGAAAALIEAINAGASPVLAVDLPSGLDADTGRAFEPVVRASRTVTMIVHKRGLFTGQARAVCGAIELADLDLGAAAAQHGAPAARLLGPAQREGWIRPRRADAHKGDHGRVLALGGDHGYGGAIRLCGEAALRAGAGLVSVATRERHVAPLLAARPELMVHVAEDARAVAELCAAADVLALGPGLGQGEWGKTVFEAALASGRPCVIDADGLNLLAAAPRAVPQAVLTPHPGEAARLLGGDVASVEDDRFVAAAALVERFGAVVVLKGAGSLIAAPGELLWVLAAGNPGMASGGTGDVLTGVIAALRAQGLPAPTAAAVGALLHSMAADEAAAQGGERGLLASDLLVPLRRLVNP